MYCKDLLDGSLHHLLDWSFIVAQLIWRRFLRLLHVVYGTRVYKWGTMMWADIKGEVQDYEKENVNFALYTRGRYVEEVFAMYVY